MRRDPILALGAVCSSATREKLDKSAVKHRSLSAARRHARQSVAFKVGDMFGGPTRLMSMTCFDPGGLELVWFRRRVLQKYHANPSRFTVAGNVVRCGSAWYVRYHVDSRGYVVTFLRDVAVGLPTEEQHHWASENVVPPPVAPGPLEHALVWSAREPDELLLECRQELGKLNRAWSQSFGWPLFYRLGSSNYSWVRMMHVPTTDEVPDFGREITYVYRLTVDRLNKPRLAQYAEGFGPDAKSRTLSNWSRMLHAERVLRQEEAPLIVRPFRVIRSLRNKFLHDTTSKLRHEMRSAGLDPCAPRAAYTHLVSTITTYAWRIRGELIMRKRA